eukprot:57418-Chlamydomonas_euryale.AAC.2
MRDGFRGVGRVAAGSWCVLAVTLVVCELSCERSRDRARPQARLLADHASDAGGAMARLARLKKRCIAAVAGGERAHTQVCWAGEGEGLGVESWMPGGEHDCPRARG